MDSGRTSTPPEYLVNANERQYLAKLCWLLHDAGTHALRVTFDSFHPPLHLRQHLGQHHIRAVLRKVYDQKVLSDKQWRTLYPTKKQDMACLTSDSFDAHILAVLLQFICHLSPPYPHGWSTLPLPHDSSLSADVVRVQMFLQQAGSLGGVRHEEYPVLWKQIVEVLLRMAGPEVRVRITRIDQETLTPEQQTHYINLVKNSWGAPDEGALGRLRKLGAGRFLGRGGGRGGSNKRKPGDKAAEEEGLSPEERAVLHKCNRQLCDVVIAEDIVDRLVQGHVINFSDRQEILTPGKNLDRMQILLSKVSQCKVNGAFKVLTDNLKLKYPRVYDSVNKVKKIVQKEGISDIMDAVSVCQEALSTHYRSLFARVTPLPWSETLTSIRDVYVPLDVSTVDGQKLQLGSILPTVVTSGRGKRVLIEGESGCGKTYLVAMLTYQWATQRLYFNNHYKFLIYLDARMIRGPLAKAVPSLVLPENCKVGPEEFLGLLEEHARETVIIIDGFDEDHSSEELRKVILGERLRHASVLLTSRPEARAARWMNPDERLYVLGLSQVNVGRCLKSYAVIAQMTSEEYDEFYEFINSPEFEFREQLGNPYLCLVVFGVFLAMGTPGLSSIITITSLMQRYLVAMATSFCRKGGMGVNGTQFSPELVSAISQFQFLAYQTLVTRGKLLNDADVAPAVQHLRTALESHENDELNDDVDGSSSIASSEKKKSEKESEKEKEKEKEEKDGGETETETETEVGSQSNTERSNVDKKPGGRRVVGFSKGKKPAVASVTNYQLLARVGLLNKVGGIVNGRWGFTCSLTREFLAARHLADMSEESVREAIQEEKIVRHPRLAQTTSFLCALLTSGDHADLLESLLSDVSIQVLKHARRLVFKDDMSSTTGNLSEDGEEGEANGVGCHVTNFSHCLQALVECSPHLSDLTIDLVKTLPKSIIIARDGLIPIKCLQGLALAVKNPTCQLTHLEIELLPYHMYQSPVLLTLAQALSENENLQSLIVRWHSLQLLVTFLKACLSKTPALHNVVLHDISGETSARKVNAATWAGLQEVCALLANTRSFTLESCGAVHVVAQWVLYLPNTVRAFHFPCCAFTSISAADLGSKLEASEHCNTLDLADTSLEASDLSALFHNLKLNSSLRTISLAGCHLDRAAATAIAEYIRLNSSVRRLDLSRSHMSSEACRILVNAMEQNYALTTLDCNVADVSPEGQEALLSARQGEITVLGFDEEYYS